MNSSPSAPVAPDRTASESRVAISVRNLVKRYDETSGGAKRGPAVDDISIDVGEGEFFTLLGPSGCGKSTTLRSVAGLETPNAGDIYLGDRHVFGAGGTIDVPTYRRKIGMVFQSYAIWPHMTVFDNVAFPLTVRPRRSRPKSAEVKRAVQEALRVVEMEDLGERPATMLSGGQQQRLALARAMVDNPEVMLLDEPLSNLDAKLRDSMRLELRRLQRRSGFTALYVTHDQVEALALSNRIAVMNNGRIEQIGSPREIYERPESEFVAKFVGRTNFLQGTVLEVPKGGGDEYVIDAGLGRPLVARGDQENAVGAQVTACIRPEHISLTSAAGAVGGDSVRGKIVTAQFLGEANEYLVEADGGQELTVRSGPETSFSRGDLVSIGFNPSACRLIRDAAPATVS